MVSSPDSTVVSASPPLTMRPEIAIDVVTDEEAPFSKRNGEL